MTPVASCVVCWNCDRYEAARVVNPSARPALIGIKQDPGQAGKVEASYYVQHLAGYNVRTFRGRLFALTAANAPALDPRFRQFAPRTRIS